MNKELIKKLADTLKVTNLEAFEKALGEDTATFELPTVTVLDESGLTTLKDNLGKEKYKEGKEAGEEMTIKWFKNKHGLEFEGKTTENLNEALTKKFEVDFKKPSNEKIQELEADKQKLVSNFETEKQSWESKFNELNSKLFNTNVDYKLKSIFPDKLDNGLDKNMLSTLFKAEYEITLDDEGKEIVKRNGQVVKDTTTTAPLPVDLVVTNWMNEKGFKKPDGRGDGDSGGSPNGYAGVKSMADFGKYLEKKNIKMGTAEAASELAKVKEANKDFTY